MSEQPLDDFAVTLELSVRDVNMLLNCLNLPLQMPTTTANYFINIIQNQAGPQVQKAKTSLEAVAKASKEKKDE
jgi:hypothetical protein